MKRHRVLHLQHRPLIHYSIQLLISIILFLLTWPGKICFQLNESLVTQVVSFRLWSGALKLPHEHQFNDFIEGLGKGQLVG